MIRIVVIGYGPVAARFIEGMLPENPVEFANKVAELMAK